MIQPGEVIAQIIVLPIAVLSSNNRIEYLKKLLSPEQFYEFSKALVQQCKPKNFKNTLVNIRKRTHPRKNNYPVKIRKISP